MPQVDPPEPPTEEEIFGHAIRTLETVRDALTDDPRALPVDEFVAQWDQVWEARKDIRASVGDIIDGLEAGVTVTPEELLRVIDYASRYVAAASRENAPTDEQRMEARMIRIERKLDKLLAGDDVPF